MSEVQKKDKKGGTTNAIGKYPIYYINVIEAQTKYSRFYPKHIPTDILVTTLSLYVMRNRDATNLLTTNSSGKTNHLH